MATTSYRPAGRWAGADFNLDLAKLVRNEVATAPGK